MRIASITIDLQDVKSTERADDMIHLPVREEEKWGDCVDHKAYLRPIIEYLKDGEDRSLSEDDIDGLMKVLRCKIEHLEGLISDGEYEEKLNNAYEK
jgi:hypothetical protein